MILMRSPWPTTPLRSVTNQRDFADLERWQHSVYALASHEHGVGISRLFLQIDQAIVVLLAHGKPSAGIGSKNP